MSVRQQQSLWIRTRTGKAKTSSCRLTASHHMWLSVSRIHALFHLVLFIVGDSPASEFYAPSFRNTLFVPSSQVVWTTAQFALRGMDWTVGSSRILCNFLVHHLTFGPLYMLPLCFENEIVLICMHDAEAVILSNSSTSSFTSSSSSSLTDVSRVVVTMKVCVLRVPSSNFHSPDLRSCFLFFGHSGQMLV